MKYGIEQSDASSNYDLLSPDGYLNNRNNKKVKQKIKKERN